MSALPDELLLNILNRLDIPDLKNVAISCRQLRRVAQGCLLERATIRPSHMFRVIQELYLNARPASRISHLQPDEVCTPIYKWQKTAPIYHHLPAGGVRNCYEIIERAFPSAYNTPWFIALHDDPGFYSVGLSLLIAQLSKLDAMSVTRDALEQIGLLKFMFLRRSCLAFPPPLWATNVLSKVCDCFVSLVIEGSFNHQESNTQTADLRSFRSLKYLKTPAHLLRCWHINPCDILPLGLETIAVNSLGEKLSTLWMNSLLVFPRHQIKLKEVTLRYVYFGHSLYNQIYVLKGIENFQDHLTRLRRGLDRDGILPEGWYGLMNLDVCDFRLASLFPEEFSRSYSDYQEAVDAVRRCEMGPDIDKSEVLIAWGFTTAHAAWRLTRIYG